MRSVMRVLPTKGSVGRTIVRIESSGGEPPGVSEGEAFAIPCGGDTTNAKHFHSTMLPWIGLGDPVRTRGKDGQASSVLTFGGPTRPKKPAPSLL